MATNRPMTVRLAQSLNADLNQRRRDRALYKPENNTGAYTSDATGTFDLTTPEGQMAFATEQLQKKRMMFQQARAQMNTPVKRTLANAFIPKRVRAQNKVMREQFNRTLSEEEARFETEAALVEQQIAEAQRAKMEYDAAVREQQYFDKAVKMWKKGVPYGLVKGPENKYLKELWKGGNYEKLLEERRQALQQKKEIINILDLPADVKTVELQKAIEGYNTKASDNLRTWQMQNPTEKLVFDNAGNVIGVESGALGKSLSLNNYEKILAKLSMPKDSKVYGVVEAFKRPTGYEGKLYDLRTAISELKTKHLRGEELTAGESAELAFNKAAENVLSVPYGLYNLAKGLYKKPIETVKGIPSGIQQAGAEMGETLRYGSAPEVGGLLAGEFLLGKGLGKVSKLSSKVVEVGRTRLSPKFSPVIDNVITLPSSDGFTRIGIAGNLDELAIPLSKQAGIAGRTVTATSGARDFYNFLVNERRVMKPIPNEEALSKTTKAMLKRFDEGKLKPSKIAELNSRIIKESGSKGLLERAFFADPYGRLRPSRLGLNEGDNSAKLMDYLVGDISFKKPKPQAIYFENVKIAEFPKSLQGIVRKLKSGKSLSKAEADKLLKWQLESSDQFKPIGFLSREPEITLAPGQIIKKNKVTGVTLINGRRVSLILSSIGKASKRLKILLIKSKKVGLTPMEFKELTMRLSSETGLSYSQINTVYISPYEKVVQGLLRMKVKGSNDVSSNPVVKKNINSFLISSPVSKNNVIKYSPRPRSPSKNYAPSRPPKSPPKSPINYIIPYRGPPSRPPKSPPKSPPTTMGPPYKTPKYGQPPLDLRRLMTGDGRKTRKILRPKKKPTRYKTLPTAIEMLVGHRGRRPKVKIKGFEALRFI